MTPAEFREFADKRIDWYEQKRNDMDALNAKRCQIAAACVGVKDAKMADYMIFTPSKPNEPQSEQSWNNSLDAWAAAGGR